MSLFSWFNAINVKIYLCQKMTGLPQYKIYKHNLKATQVLEKHGIIVLSPVIEEDIKPCNKKMNQPSQKQLAFYWNRDKWMIRQSHVLFDIAGNVVSQGVTHELGFSRYFLFRPVVRLLKIKGPSVAIEEDSLVDSVEDAAKLIVKNWGTPWRRLKWKFRLFGRCFFPYIKTRIAWFVDWV